MRLWLIVLLALAPGCRKKRPPTQADPSPPPTVATAAAVAPGEAPAPATNAPSLDLALGTGPSATEVRSAVESVLPKIEKCVQNNPVKRTTALRFRISIKGEVDNSQIVGNPDADDCVAEVLKTLKFTPWNGEAQMVGLPITPEGKLLRERPPGVD